MSVLDLVADPIRLAILRRIARGGPASLQELADAAGVHVNTARAHVVALEEGGALESRTRERPGRGRTGREYILREGWSLGAPWHSTSVSLGSFAGRISPRSSRCAARDIVARP